jgi:hypothetical protein
MYVLNDEFYRFKNGLNWKINLSKRGGIRSQIRIIWDPYPSRPKNSTSHRIQIHKAEGESFRACEKYSREQAFSLEFLRETWEKRKSTKDKNYRVQDGIETKISRYCFLHFIHYSLLYCTSAHTNAVFMNNSNFT